jgi:hypothetical protein
MEACARAIHDTGSRDKSEILAPWAHELLIKSFTAYLQLVQAFQGAQGARGVSGCCTHSAGAKGKGACGCWVRCKRAAAQDQQRPTHSCDGGEGCGQGSGSCGGVRGCVGVVPRVTAASKLAIIPDDDVPPVMPQVWYGLVRWALYGLFACLARGLNSVTEPAQTYLLGEAATGVVSYAAIPVGPPC